MREILFRGKRIDNGEWVEGYLILKGNQTFISSFPYFTGKIHETSWLEFCFGGFIGVIPETVGQYTGLTDKNGKKIFEGDIIKIVPDYDYSDDYSISKVYSYNGIFCVDYHGDNFYSTALGFLEDYLPDGDFEVIGNIYDSPELLEV